MPFGLSWYSACCCVIFSDAAVDEIRNRSAADAPFAMARISFRRKLSVRCSTMKFLLLMLRDELTTRSEMVGTRSLSSGARSRDPLALPTLRSENVARPSLAADELQPC